MLPYLYKIRSMKDLILITLIHNFSSRIQKWIFNIYISLFNTHRVLQFELVYPLYLLHLEISWCPLEDHYIDQRFLSILGEWFVGKGFLHLRTEKKLTWREYKSDIQLHCFSWVSKQKYHNILTINYSTWINWRQLIKRVIMLNLCAIKPHHVTK